MTAVRFEQSGEQMHQRGFAAARGTEQADSSSDKIELGVKYKRAKLFLNRYLQVHGYFLSRDLLAAPLASKTAKESRIDTRQSESAIRSPPGELVYS